MGRKLFTRYRRERVIFLYVPRLINITHESDHWPLMWWFYRHYAMISAPNIINLFTFFSWIQRHHELIKVNCIMRLIIWTIDPLASH